MTTNSILILRRRTGFSEVIIGLVLGVCALVAVSNSITVIGSWLGGGGARTAQALRGGPEVPVHAGKVAKQDAQPKPRDRGQAIRG